MTCNTSSPINKIGFFLLALTFTMVFEVKAQREPQYTQYMYNIGSFNPAYVGTVEASGYFWAVQSAMDRYTRGSQNNKVWGEYSLG